MDVVGDFFRALPDIGRALWEFADGFYGVVVTIASLLLVAVFLFLAKVLRDEHGWISATFGTLAVTVGMFWGFGVIPSAWVYFVDGSRESIEGVVIPSALPGMDNFYVVFRDLVVLGMTGIAMGALVVTALVLQKRYPQSLAEGEEARPQSGGYK